jgi:hypothetical protein
MIGQVLVETFQRAQTHLGFNLWAMSPQFFPFFFTWHLAFLIHFQITEILIILQLKIERKTQKNVMLKNYRLVTFSGMINFEQHAYGNP